MHLQRDLKRPINQGKLPFRKQSRSSTTILFTMKKLSPTRTPSLSDILKEAVGSKLSDRRGDYKVLEFKPVTRSATGATARHARLHEASSENRNHGLPEATKVLLQILLDQERSTLAEYTVNSVTFKVFVVEDTEL